MRHIGDVKLADTAGPTGSPQMLVEVDDLQFDEEGRCTHAASSLARADVEQLREACDDFLEGRRL